jgi:hypothetical protein
MTAAVSAAPGSGGSPASAGPVAAGGSPAASSVYAGIDRIVVVVMENHSYNAIVNSAKMPYLNSLIAKYGLATNYTGVAHPSEPNYLALFSGDTQGVTDDAVYNFSGRNLADQLEAKGRTWRVVAENVPLGCFTGATSYGGPDGPGWYARKHEPAIMFTGIAGNPTRCARITDLRHFALTAANFQLVVPNMCHDMHDCSLATGDAFLKKFLTPITASPAFAKTLVVVTFDEGTDSAGGGGRIATVLIGPMVRRAARSSIAHNHYSLLRTIENVWSLGCLSKSCAANDLREFFGGTAAARV